MIDRTRTLGVIESDSETATFSLPYHNVPTYKYTIINSHNKLMGRDWRSRYYPMFYLVFYVLFFLAQDKKIRK